MTGRELMRHLQDHVEEEQKSFSVQLTIPQLMHIKAAMDREFFEAFYDPGTPCPHDGTKWQIDGIERCGQCGRRISELVTEDK